MSKRRLTDHGQDGAGNNKAASAMKKYEPLKILGEGSFGKVYLMKNVLKRRLVCVKVIKVNKVPRKEREACCQEVELMQRLCHPNIVGYEESFLSPKQDSLFIVMQYCDGGDLSARIKSSGGQFFPEGKVLSWFVQTSLGLHHLHSNRIIHRDLKTQNIFLLGNGRLVLGDLGISKVLDGTNDFAETLIGPYSMSPEIFQNKPYNYKSDIWALGCVLYEMLTLSHAFDAGSLHGLAAKVIQGRYLPIDDRYSSHVRELIAEMLSTDPTRRPDLDTILKKPFIKRHIQEFFIDIMNRPSTSIGEGTMAVKVAAMSAAQGGAFLSPRLGRYEGEIEALRRQLEELDLHMVIAKALNPPEEPTTARGAIRIAREQASALRREEERKQIVEETLAKLRAEREERLRMRRSSNGDLLASAAESKALQRPPASSRGDSGHMAIDTTSFSRDREQARPSTTKTPSKATVTSAAGDGAPAGGERRPNAVSALALNDPRLILQRRAAEAEEKQKAERKDDVTSSSSSKALIDSLSSPSSSSTRSLISRQPPPFLSSEASSRQIGLNNGADLATPAPPFRLPRTEDGEDAVIYNRPKGPPPLPLSTNVPSSPISNSSAHVEGHHRKALTGANSDGCGIALDSETRHTPRGLLSQMKTQQQSQERGGLLTPTWAQEKLSDGDGAVAGRQQPHPVSNTPPLRPPGTSKSSPAARAQSKGDVSDFREDEEEDLFEMLGRTPEDESENEVDDDLREREVQLERELEVATQRMEEIKKTIVHTKSFLQQNASQQAIISSNGSAVNLSSKALPGEIEGAHIIGGRRSSFHDLLETIETEYDDYEDDYEEEEEEVGSSKKVFRHEVKGSYHRGNGAKQDAKAGGASAYSLLLAKKVDSTLEIASAAGGAKGHPSLPPFQSFPSSNGGPVLGSRNVAEAKDEGRPKAVVSRRNEELSTDEAPRSGRLDDRIRDSRALLVRMLGVETFRRAYTTARELQQAADSDPSEPLDRHEGRKRSTLEPILKEKIKCLDLLTQLIFMEDSQFT